jgi:hypothetical protein
VEDVVRPHHGTAIHTREALQLGPHSIHSVQGLDLLLQTGHTSLAGLNELDVLSLYRSEKFSSIATFCEHLTPLLVRMQSRCALIAGNFEYRFTSPQPPYPNVTDADVQVRLSATCVGSNAQIRSVARPYLDSLECREFRNYYWCLRYKLE